MVDVETAGQRRFNPHSDVLLECARSEVRGAHYAGWSPCGAPINSERASIWVQASSSSASPTHCCGKEGDAWGDADLTSLSMWICTLFAQLRVSSCRTSNAFMHTFAYFSDRIRAAGMRCWEVALWRMDCLCIVSTKVRHPYICLQCSPFCLSRVWLIYRSLWFFFFFT